MGPLWGANKNCTPCGIEHSTARMAPDGPIGVRGPEAPGPSGSLFHPSQISSSSSRGITLGSRSDGQVRIGRLESKLDILESQHLMDKKASPDVPENLGEKHRI